MHGLSMSLRKTVLAGAIGITVFGFTAQPVFAADNILQQVQQSITSQFEKLYLQLIPGEKSGKLVLKQVGIASQHLTSFEGKTAIQVTARDADQTIGTANFTAVGPTVMGQIWDTNSYKQDLAITGTLSYQDQTLEAAANLKMIDSVTYLQVTKLPEVKGADLQDLANTWVKFDPVQTVETSESAPAPWTPAQQQKMQEAFYKMLNASEVSPAKVEKKDSVDVYVFTATLSKPAVAEYLNTVQQIEEEMAAQSNTPVPSAMPAETEKMLDNVGEIKATFWVDKGNFYPRHMELPLEINVKQAMTDEEETAAMIPQSLPVNNVETVEVMITSDLSKHNQSFTITAPENPEDSQVFFTKLMGTFMPGVSSMMVPSSAGKVPAGYRLPTIGTTELPTMSAEQQKALEQYERMMQDLQKNQ